MAYAAIIDARKEAEKGMDTVREAVALHRQRVADRVAASKAKGKPPGIAADDPDILFYHEALDHAKSSWAYFVRLSFCKSINIVYDHSTMRDMQVPDTFVAPTTYRDWFMNVSWD